MQPATQASPNSFLAGLPCAQRILDGVDDLMRNRHTIESCLVRIARPRLCRAGLIAPTTGPQDQTAEMDLYEILAGEGDRAYGRYNSLLRELSSFERALDHRLKRKGRERLKAEMGRAGEKADHQLVGNEWVSLPKVTRQS